MKLKSIWLPLVILVSGFVIMMVLISMKSDPPAKNKKMTVKQVESQVLKTHSEKAKIIAFGKSQSAQPVDLFAEVAGQIRNGDIMFQPGQRFKKGNLLLRIDDRQARLDLNSAKSDLLNALATVLPDLKIDFPGQYTAFKNFFDATSFETKLMPLPDYSDFKVKMYLSRFNIFKLYFQTRNLEIKLEKYSIYAPFNGSIVSTELRHGSNARVGSKLGTIVDLGHMEILVDVAVSDLPWIDRTQDVILHSDQNNAVWRGRISRIGDTIDPHTQTVKSYITILNGSSPLLDGAFVKAEIAGISVNDAIALPRKAIYRDRYVYLVNKGVLEQKEIQIKRKETDRIFVAGGLSEGDTLVTELLQGVLPGMPAKARQLSADGTN